MPVSSNQAQRHGPARPSDQLAVQQKPATKARGDPSFKAELDGSMRGAWGEKAGSEACE